MLFASCVRNLEMHLGGLPSGLRADYRYEQAPHFMGICLLTSHPQGEVQKCWSQTLQLATSFCTGSERVTYPHQEHTTLNSQYSKRLLTNEEIFQEANNS